MAQYHISPDDLLWKYPWAFWQRMLIDSPKYEMSDSEKKEKGIIPIDTLEEQMKIFGAGQQ